MTQYIYCHTFADGKRYFGISINPLQRWKNGLGYRDNHAMQQQIYHDGWHTIRHEVLAEVEDNEMEGLNLETALIEYYDTTNPDIGFNQSSAWARYDLNTDYMIGLLEKYNLLDLQPKPIENAEELIEKFNEDKHKDKNYPAMIAWHWDHLEEAKLNPLPEYDDPIYQKMFKEEGKRRLAAMGHLELVSMKFKPTHENGYEITEKYLQERRDKFAHRMFKIDRYYKERRGD